MQFLNQYMSSFVTALLVLGAAVLLMLAYRMFNSGIRARKGPRLGITEYYDVDKNRRIILVRRDDVEHLVMIGGGQDLVIEQNIETGLTSELPMRQMPTIPPAHNVQTLPIRPSPRPAVFGNNRPPLRPVSPTFKSFDQSLKSDNDI